MNQELIVELVRRKGGTVYFPQHSNIGTSDIGIGCTLHSHIWIGDEVSIGDYVKIQAFTFIPNGVTIGDYVFIGPRVTFTNDKKPPSNEVGRIIVEEGVSIGAGAIILPNVILGKGCRVGAGSVVTKSVPAGALVYGNPARIHT